MRSAVVGRN